MKVKLLRDGIIPPKKAYAGDAGFDIFAPDDFYVEDRYISKIDTGLALEIPSNYVGLIMDRSSYGANQIKVMGGVIDSSYRGEIIITLLYLSSPNRMHQRIKISKGERIAQLLIIPIAPIDEMEIVTDLSKTIRGERRFGSSNDKR